MSQIIMTRDHRKEVTKREWGSKEIKCMRSCYSTIDNEIRNPDIVIQLKGLSMAKNDCALMLYNRLVPRHLRTIHKNHFK